MQASLPTACVVVVALTGCGRFGFDSRADDDAAPDAASSSSISLELPGGGQFIELAASPANDAWYAVASFGPVFRSTNLGVTWERCADAGQLVRGLEVGSDGTVYAAGPTVLTSSDLCASWSDSNAPRHTLALGIAGSIPYGAADDGLYRFTDSWMRVPTPLDGTIFRAFGASATTMIGGTYGKGLVVSTDGGTNWIAKSAGLPTQDIVDISVAATRSYALTGATAGFNGGVACSDGAGIAWTTCLAAGGTAMIVDPLDELHVLVAVYDDFGETANGFTAFTRGLRATSGLDEGIIHDLLYTKADTLIAATDRGVFSSTGRPLSFGGSQTGLAGWSIEHIVRDGADIFASTRGGMLRSIGGQPFTISTTGMLFNTNIDRHAFAPDGTLVAPGRFIWGSRDRGQTWETLTPLGPEDGFYGNAVAFDGERAYVGTETRVHRADPPYTTWTPFLVAGATRNVNDVAVVGGAVYAATNEGLFVSTDAAASWQMVPQVAVTATPLGLGVLPDGGLVIASTSGVFVSDPSRATWSQHSPGLVLRTIVVGPDIIVAIGFDDGAIASRDRGLTWTVVATPPGVKLVSGIVDPGDGSLVLGTAGHGLVRVAW